MSFTTAQYDLMQKFIDLEQPVESQNSIDEITKRIEGDDGLNEQVDLHISVRDNSDLLFKDLILRRIETLNDLNSGKAPYRFVIDGRPVVLPNETDSDDEIDWVFTSWEVLRYYWTVITGAFKKTVDKDPPNMDYEDYLAFNISGGDVLPELSNEYAVYHNKGGDWEGLKSGINQYDPGTSSNEIITNILWNESIHTSINFEGDILIIGSSMTKPGNYTEILHKSQVNVEDSYINESEIELNYDVLDENDSDDKEIIDIINAMDSITYLLSNRAFGLRRERNGLNKVKNKLEILKENQENRDIIFNKLLEE